MQKKGLFITFEGTDGVGKTTQAHLLIRALKKKGFRTLLTREPGGGKVSEKIRKILLDPKTNIEDLTELFLYQAARIEHVQKIIRPALRKNMIVICDRYTDATLAYQGYARNLSKGTIEKLNKIATGALYPKLTILLDLEAKKGLAKAKSRKKGGDRLENEGVNFQKRVRQGYLSLARKYPSRIKKVPVQDSVLDTQKLIQKIIFRKVKK